MSAEPALMAIVPWPSSSIPPPASPAWLSLTMLWLSVSFHGTFVVFSIAIPPPSAVAWLSVTTV